MASSGLKIEQQVLRSLAEGPQSKVGLRRGLGWSQFGQHRQLDSLLQRMREAGLIQTGPAKGQWQIVPGLQVCPRCLGKGLIAGDAT